MPIRLCRGPLAKPVWENAIFCAPDNDVPWQASGLNTVPRLSHVHDGDHILIYLEAHRAPDCVWAVLQKLKCDVVVQGDPLALRPKDCNLIAAKLENEPDLPWFCPAMDFFLTLEECIAHCEGDWRILAPDKQSAQMTCAKLRGSANHVQSGDLVYDRKHNQIARVLSPQKVVVGLESPGTTVTLDDGRLVNARNLYSYLVQTVGNFRSGECDVLVILPNVSECLGTMAIRRVRHKVIGLGWHPSVFI